MPCAYCAGAHSAQERTQTPLQTNLISYNIEGEEVKEWHISTPEGMLIHQCHLVGASDMP